MYPMGYIRQSRVGEMPRSGVRSDGRFALPTPGVDGRYSSLPPGVRYDRTGAAVAITAGPERRTRDPVLLRNDRLSRCCIAPAMGLGRRSLQSPIASLRRRRCAAPTRFGLPQMPWVCHLPRSSIPIRGRTRSTDGNDAPTDSCCAQVVRLVCRVQPDGHSRPRGGWGLSQELGDRDNKGDRPLFSQRWSRRLVTSS